ncbi:hypothetical protein O181_020174 [Austropuccinia psidii MF-1]|uniref:Uncharacterized protein n=1 Tax=Austropuccinia psidii MF-1 TaxID=1389203 RepID=A0A9Q3GVF7_9BASI|nr:hypothetical protein [Austropuccinia psidii MF-1]
MNSVLDHQEEFANLAIRIFAHNFAALPHLMLPGRLKQGPPIIHKPLHYSAAKLVPVQKKSPKIRKKKAEGNITPAAGNIGVFIVAKLKRPNISCSSAPGAVRRGESYSRN